MMQRLLIGLVKAYRLLLSPWLGSSCRFEPTCSVYAIERAGAAWRGRRQLSHAAPHRPLPALVPGRPRSGSPQGAATDPGFGLAVLLSLLRRQEVFFMNDIRRTILWVIFGFSLVLLWDQWQVYNGKKPTFLPSTKPHASATAPATAPAGAASGAVPPASVRGCTAPAAPVRARRPGRHDRGAGGEPEGGGQHRRAQADLRHRRRLAGAKRIHPARRPDGEGQALRPARPEPEPLLRGADRPDRRHLPHAQDADDLHRRARAEGRRQRAGAALRIARPGRRQAGQDLDAQARRPTTWPCATRSSIPARRRCRRSSTCSSCATATSRRASRPSIRPSPARPSTPRPRSSRRSSSRTSRTTRPTSSRNRPTATSRWCSTTSPAPGC